MWMWMRDGDERDQRLGEQQQDGPSAI